MSDVNTSHLWFSFKQIEHVSLASFLSKLTSIVVVYEELSGTLINFFVDDLCPKLSFFKLSAFFLSVLLSWFLLCFRKLKIGVDYINIWSYRNENGIRFLLLFTSQNLSSSGSFLDSTHFFFKKIFWKNFVLFLYVFVLSIF